MNLAWIAAGAALVIGTACSPTDGKGPDRLQASSNLPTPDVIIQADPPPPFTYWAPQGATIRNHPRQAGVWIAQAEGRPDRYYFGDRCRASRYQRFVGRPVAEMPDAPQGAVWRTHCSTCAVTQELAPHRMNISFDTETGTIVAIACG